jgi:hypothetical protein
MKEGTSNIDLTKKIALGFITQHGTEIERKGNSKRMKARLNAARVRNVSAAWSTYFQRTKAGCRHFNISCLVAYSYQDPYFNVISFSKELP